MTLIIVCVDSVVKLIISTRYFLLCTSWGCEYHIPKQFNLINSFIFETCYATFPYVLCHFPLHVMPLSLKWQQAHVYCGCMGGNPTKKPQTRAEDRCSGERSQRGKIWDAAPGYQVWRSRVRGVELSSSRLGRGNHWASLTSYRNFHYKFYKFISWIILSGKFSLLNAN